MTTTASSAPDAPTRALILKAPEVRRLRARGDALVVRPVRPQPERRAGFDDDGIVMIRGRRHSGPLRYLLDRLAEYGCPLGRVGEERWVKETWGSLQGSGRRTVFRADGDPCDLRDGTAITPMSWRSAVHLPRHLARATVRVERVRVVPLHALTSDDALCAGAVRHGDATGAGWRMDWSELGTLSRFAGGSHARGHEQRLTVRDIGLSTPRMALRNAVQRELGENPYLWAVRVRQVDGR